MRLRTKSRNSQTARALVPKSAPIPPRTQGRLRRISTACERCRRLKIRCTGEPQPCRTCGLAESECEFDHSLDGRRRRPTFDLELLKDLIDCICFGDHHTIDSIRRCLRQRDMLWPTKKEMISGLAQSLVDKIKPYERVVLPMSEFEDANKLQGSASPAVTADVQEIMVSSTSGHASANDIETPLRFKNMHHTCANDVAAEGNLAQLNSFETSDFASGSESNPILNASLQHDWYYVEADADLTTMSMSFEEDQTPWHVISPVIESSSILNIHNEQEMSEPKCPWLAQRKKEISQNAKNDFVETARQRYDQDILQVHSQYQRRVGEEQAITQDIHSRARVQLKEVDRSQGLQPIRIGFLPSIPEEVSYVEVKNNFVSETRLDAAAYYCFPKQSSVCLPSVQNFDSQYL